MPSVQVRITNMPQIRVAFGRAPQLMSRHLSDAIKKSTFLVLGQSKIRTPVRTGYLRASHKTLFEGAGLGFRGVVEPTANYALFVHEGTRFQKAQPFLRRGLEASQGQIQGYFNQAVQSVFNDIGAMV